MKFLLSSTKGGKVVTGTLSDAIRAAIKLDRELQPAYGVLIENDTDPLYQTVEASGDSVIRVVDGGDRPGTIVLDTDDTLTLIWSDNGAVEPFAESIELYQV